MSPANSPSDGPEIPPDIPPEYVDAYLVGFQRGFGGEVEPVVSQPVEVTPEREPATSLDKLERPTDELERPTEELDKPAADTHQRGHDELDRPTGNSERPTEALDRPGRSRPNTERPEDMEWLFERDRDAPLGWAFNPAEEDSTADQAGSNGPGAGSTSTAVEASAGKGEGRSGRSPWVVLAGFLAILVVLMLVAYIGGMAFSTIVNR